jgi:hypothetical protein
MECDLKQTRTDERNKNDCKMRLPTPEEKRFLDVFLLDATTAPFGGPATKALHGIGVEYGDISYIANLKMKQACPLRGASCREPRNALGSVQWTLF